MSHAHCLHAYFKPGFLESLLEENDNVLFVIFCEDLFMASPGWNTEKENRLERAVALTMEFVFDILTYRFSIPR